MAAWRPYVKYWPQRRRWNAGSIAAITPWHLYMGETRQISELAWWGQSMEQDIVIFGHTHVPVFKQISGIWLLNPGSPARPREGSHAGFAVLTLNRGHMPAVEFMEV